MTSRFPKLLIPAFLVVAWLSFGCSRQVPTAPPQPSGAAGSLAFCIVANLDDDRDAINRAQVYYPGVATDEKWRTQLDQLAQDGKPPPPPLTDKGEKAFSTGYTYTWVPLSIPEVDSLRKLQDASWDKITKAGQRGETILLTGYPNQALLYSRPCVNKNFPEEDRKTRERDYFLLIRDAEVDPKTGESLAITAQHVANVREDVDRNLRPAIQLQLTPKGGELLYELTSKNKPTLRDGESTYRHMAIIVGGEIVSAPRLNEAIRQEALISGNFTQAEVRQMVRTIQGK